LVIWKQARWSPAGARDRAALSVATPAYLRGRAAPRTPEDLKTHQCIVYPRLSPANEWAFESEHGRHVVPVKGAILVDDADAMETAVRHHLGLAIFAGLECDRGHTQRPA
jgi:DNA-binding transcriptional LysR family regulator